MNNDILRPVENFDEIKNAAEKAVRELCDVAELKRGDILVVTYLFCNFFLGHTKLFSVIAKFFAKYLLI